MFDQDHEIKIGEAIINQFNVMYERSQKQNPGRLTLALMGSLIPSCIATICDRKTWPQIALWPAPNRAMVDALDIFGETKFASTLSPASRWPSLMVLPPSKKPSNRPPKASIS